MRFKKMAAIFMAAVIWAVISIPAGETAFAATYSDVPEQIVCSPHGDLKTQVGFAWVTRKNNSAAMVQVVEKTGATPDFAAGNVKTYQGEAGDIDNWRWHKAVASGLQPNTTYQYRVGDGTNWSDTGEFTTAPDTEDAIDGGFSFLQVNDPQGTSISGYTAWSTALERAAETFPNYKFIVHGGDHVDNGSDENQWQWFFKTAQSTLSKSIFASATGNHDAYTGNRFAYRFPYQMPTDSPTTMGMYYSFDYANAHFTVINAQAVSDSKQMDWVKYDIAKNSKKWNIVIIHNPLYTNADHYAEVDIRNQFESVLNDMLGVDMIFAGHDHIYNRTYPILNNAPIPGSALLTNQTVAGQTGVSLWDNPVGTLNQVNNACGTKFYNLNVNADTKWFVPLPFAGGAYGYQPGQPTFAGVTVTENEIVNTVYTVNGSNQTLLESSGIRKDRQQVNPPKNVKETYDPDRRRLTITWEAPDAQTDSRQEAQRFVVYDENNAYNSFYTRFLTGHSVTLSIPQDIYEKTNFVIKTVGVHSFSEAASMQEDVELVTFTAVPGVFRADLSWSDPADGMTAQKLEISSDGQRWTALSVNPVGGTGSLQDAKLSAPLDITDRSAQVTGLQAGVPYYFRLTITGGSSENIYTAQAVPIGDGSITGTGDILLELRRGDGTPYRNINQSIAPGAVVAVKNNTAQMQTVFLRAAMYRSGNQLSYYRILPIVKDLAPGQMTTVPLGNLDAIDTTDAQCFKVISYIGQLFPLNPGNLPLTLTK